jgi:hypothetical protein
VFAVVMCVAWSGRHGVCSRGGVNLQTAVGLLRNPPKANRGIRVKFTNGFFPRKVEQIGGIFVSFA